MDNDRLAYFRRVIKKRINLPSEKKKPLISYFAVFPAQGYVPFEIEVVFMPKNNSQIIEY